MDDGDSHPASAKNFQLNSDTWKHILLRKFAAGYVFLRFPVGFHPRN